jgi:hypothetical protein
VLRPEWSALLMSLSSIVVAVNKEAGMIGTLTVKTP